MTHESGMRRKFSRDEVLGGPPAAEQDDRPFDDAGDAPEAGVAAADRTDFRADGDLVSTAWAVNQLHALVTDPRTS